MTKGKESESVRQYLVPLNKYGMVHGEAVEIEIPPGAPLAEVIGAGLNKLYKNGAAQVKLTSWNPLDQR